MSEQRDKSSGAWAVALILALTLGMPVLYVLSVGPFVWLVSTS
jgi:hypothetical protein